LRRWQRTQAACHKSRLLIMCSKLHFGMPSGPMTDQLTDALSDAYLNSVQWCAGCSSGGCLRLEAKIGVPL